MSDKEHILYEIPLESAIAAMERTIRRLWVLCIIMIILFVGTNAFWIWQHSQYERVVTESTITQDFDTGSGGEITNGDVNINGENEADR
jgi:hypothetical protein